MLIQCTKKLLNELKIKEVAHIDEEPLFSWHANLIIINRRKTVVLVNDKNRYVVVLHGLKAKDFKKIDELIVDAIRQTLRAECIKDEVIDEFIQHSNHVFYAKTKNKSLVARMNKGCDEAHFNARDLNNNLIIQSEVGIRSSSSLVGDGKNSYIYSNQTMYDDLAAFSGKQIFGCQAVELKVRLELDNFHVWRTVIVPLNSSFKKLHKVLQIVFSWQNYHLHDFYIYDGEKQIINLVCDQEAFSYQDDIPLIIETDKKLSDYVPTYKKIKYSYDFGDNWEHYIEVVRMIDDYPKKHPECLEGEGNSPPEDVGGNYGYEEFLTIISEPNHPEHQDMLQWGQMQGYQDFDIDHINKELKLKSNRF